MKLNLKKNLALDYYIAEVEKGLKNLTLLNYLDLDFKSNELDV